VSVGGAVPSSRGFDALVSALPAVACTCLCCTVSLTSCPCVARWTVPCRWVGRSRVREGSMHCQLHLLLPRNVDACMHACQCQLQMQPTLGCCICHHGALVCRPPGCAYGAAGVCCMQCTRAPSTQMSCNFYNGHVKLVCARRRCTTRALSPHSWSAPPATTSSGGTPARKEDRQLSRVPRSRKNSERGQPRTVGCPHQRLSRLRLRHLQRQLHPKPQLLLRKCQMSNSLCIYARSTARRMPYRMSELPPPSPS
jgi:hypothetical protein